MWKVKTYKNYIRHIETFQTFYLIIVNQYLIIWAFYVIINFCHNFDLPLHDFFFPYVVEICFHKY